MEGRRGIRVGRRVAAAAGALALASFALMTVPSHASTVRAPASSRPNIVLILTDDQRWDSLAELPATNALSWRRYTRAFVDDPMCCPSRASTLTGRTPNHTGVDSLLEGARLDERRTFATMLHVAGYQTVF